MNRPPADVLHRTQARLRRSWWFFLAILVAIVAVELAVGLSMDRETDVSRDLWHYGSPVAAEVTGLVDRATGPAELEIRFDWEEAERTYSIPPLWVPFPEYWFQTWDSDLVGDRVTVLFDPENPERVRLQDQTILAPLSAPILIGFLALGAMVASAWERNREALRAARSGDWISLAVVAHRGALSLVPLVHAATEEAIYLRRTRHELEPGPGWVARHNRTVVAIHGTSEIATVAKLPRSLARQPGLLSPPAESTELVSALDA